MRNKLRPQKFLLPLAVFALLVVFLWLGLGLNSRELPSPLIGRAAPEFDAERLFEDTRLAPRDFHGRVWLLNVWASWCVACRWEHAWLHQIAEINIAPIVGLNYKDERGAARAWLAELGNPYTAIAVDRAGDIGIDYGVYGVPETYLIDKLGVIRFKHIGPLTQDSVERMLPLMLQLAKAP